MMKFAKALYLGLCLEALFSIAYRPVYLLTHSRLPSSAAGVAALLFAACCYRMCRPIMNVLGALFPASAVTSRWWLPSWLVIGLLLRMAWVLVFPVTLKSDGLSYYINAVQMARHSYTGGYWPPGLPLVLAPLMMVLGGHAWVTTLLSIFEFVGVCSTAWLLARKLAGTRAAGIAAAVLAVWPGYFTIGGTNCKEGLIALFVTTAMLLYLQATDRQRTRWWLMASSGLLAGMAALTQPGSLLFPIVVLVIELMRRSGISASFGRTAFFSVSMLLAVLPWTYRNERVLHHSVLISTNGGSSFYLANNPLANAAYEPEGAVRLPKDMYEGSRVGYQEGKRWIAGHPMAFLALSVRKQVVFLGDDGIGPYETLKRDLDPSGPFYAGIKAICSGYWLALWLVMLLGTPWLFGVRPLALWYGLCFMPIVYQWLIDSVFLSASRHHLSYVGLFAVMAGMAIALADSERESGPETIV